MAEVFLANRMLAISCIGVCTCVCVEGEKGTQQHT